MTGPTSSAEHPDELLSAHVDGELDPGTAAWVEDHLAACPTCREAEGELRAAKTMLRSLPAVDAAPVIEGFLARHRSTIRLGVGFVVVVALALGALAANAATHREAVVPDLPALVGAHESSRHEDVGDMVPVAADTYADPPGLIGSAVRLSRHEVYDGTDLGAVVYRDGDVVLSVYQQPGRLDWDRLPPGDTEAVGEQEVWFRGGAPIVAVAQKGDLVVTLVSDDRAAVLTALGGLPEWRRRATWDRVHDACQRFAQVFALGG